MCGIVAVAARRDVVANLIGGLQALEYRGYDSAGIALIDGGRLERRRTLGKVAELADRCRREPLHGATGIAHTRWATHGVPAERNAHPMLSGERIALVHNGIIENHAELRAELSAQGYTFSSDTDTEVMAHLIEAETRRGRGLLAAVQVVLPKLRGAYAIAVMSVAEPGLVVGARQGSPLVIGLGAGENYLASDSYALLSLTQRFVYLGEGDVAAISADQVAIFDANGNAVERLEHQASFGADAVLRGEYRHYMLKEIHEQPAAITDTLAGRIAGDHLLPGIFGPSAEPLLRATRAVQIVACGSSYHAALVARHWIETLARIPVSVDIASEFRYRDPIVADDSLLVTVSQSGETADTLAALRMARGMGYLAQLAIGNVPQSSMLRESDLVLLTRAGPEIGVASTKAFITQLSALLLLALELGRLHGLATSRLAEGVRELAQLPGAVAAALAQDATIKKLAERFASKQHALFLGRGSHFPIAMEGALKLKEISYIHAEAYPAGELKHGPLALVDADMPVIAVAPNDHLLEKLKSNIEEVRARGGQLIVFADQSVSRGITHPQETLIELAPVGALIAPIVFTVPLQLLAYHVAVLRGTDVDQPRNLAKSVTVE